MKMDARKQQVLLAIITDFIATAEPVGSRTIARKYDLGVSPATIRNEMSDLEEMGYIEQPHTSAGRIPSQLGYRYYVDFLMKKKNLTSKEEETIRRGYENKVRQIGEVITRTGEMLAQMTRFAAVIMTPRLELSSFKRIQLVLMNPGQAMVIVVMNTGALQSNIIEIPEEVSQVDLDTISQVLNAKLNGLTLDKIKVTLLREIYFELSRHKNIVDLAMHLIQTGLAVNREDKIYLGGIINILNQPEFHNIEKVKSLLSLLEQEELLRSLLESSDPGEGVAVRIGSEMMREEVKDCSMVVASYCIDGRPMGTLGVLGPTRMDYAWVVSVVEYMTRNMSETMEKMFRGWR
ncbi:MAG: heat-inducible transcriptional repressor HrcA [Peptococcaceae bacterium]|nr:heat-inducible transcriptional repressor HrcA [Peptococcaceae bacterium]